MLQYVQYALSPVAGFLVKWVDWIEDDKKGKSALKFPIAIAYGLIIGYLISRASFTELFLGAMIAQVFARKIDNIGHVTGIIASVAAIIYFGLPVIALNYFFFFLILAFLDEQDYIGKYRAFTEYRLFLKIGAVLTVLTGRWDYAIAILLFDVGYLLFTEVQKRFIK
ncbi:hypothetical protein H0O02_05175 [Candidatus Micrarchaeota archaeon]|nr:hypothetical protein [Candidatus Micrarchaeota archaeon]